MLLRASLSALLRVLRGLYWMAKGPASEIVSRKPILEGLVKLPQPTHRA